ncbi:MAG: hypothetical protein AB8D78_10315 [Akkermansiaceae bacterium]
MKKNLLFIFCLILSSSIFAFGAADSNENQNEEAAKSRPLQEFYAWQTDDGKWKYAVLDRKPGVRTKNELSALKNVIEDFDSLAKALKKASNNIQPYPGIIWNKHSFAKTPEELTRKIQSIASKSGLLILPGC